MPINILFPNTTVVSLFEILKHNTAFDSVSCKLINFLISCIYARIIPRVFTLPYLTPFSF